MTTKRIEQSSMATQADQPWIVNICVIVPPADQPPVTNLTAEST